MSSRRSGTLAVPRGNNNNSSAVPARSSKRQSVKEDIHYAPVALIEDLGVLNQHNEDENEREDGHQEDDEQPAPVPGRRRGRPFGPSKRKAPASEDGIEDQLQPEPKKGRGRPRKEAVGGRVKAASNAQAKAVGKRQVQTRVESEDEVWSHDDEEEQADEEREEEDEEPIPTLEDLMDRLKYQSYSKFKLPADSEDDTADDLTFAVGKTVALRAPPGTKTEWLARIDYIAAANQALVYCLVTWFYLPAQLRELGIPTVRRPKFLKGEVYLSDHREVIETSTVDSHVKIDFHPSNLPASSDYFYRKQVVTKAETHKEIGGKGRFYKPYIADVPEE